MDVSGIGRMLAHMEWADRRVLALFAGRPLAEATGLERVFSHLRLAQLGSRVPAGRVREAVRLFSHVLAAERIWLLRLLGEDAREQPIWPRLELREMTALVEANHAGYAAFLAASDEAGLDEEIGYPTQRGAPFRTSGRDILIHVAMHGAYHRGQIAAALRAAGGAPVGTDYILFSREIGGGGESIEVPLAVSPGELPAGS